MSGIVLFTASGMIMLGFILGLCFLIITCIPAFVNAYCSRGYYSNTNILICALCGDGYKDGKKLKHQCNPLCIGV